MKKITLILIALLFVLTLPAMAGSEKTITLKDGSKIVGRIIGVENGRYVVDSPTVGEIRVKQSDIVKIAVPGEPESQPEVQNTPETAQNTVSQTANVPPQYADQIQALQKKLLSDPELMADIQVLAQDPQVSAALTDPSFLQAINTGNIQAVQASPHLQTLLQNPKMQAFIQKVQAQQQ